MGAILKRWRREERPEEVLEMLQKQLKELETACQKNEQFYQKLIGRLMLYSIVMYIITAMVVYFYYFPKYWKARIVRSLPLLAFPFMIYGVRRFLMFLFSWRKKSNARKLEELKSKKNKVIENVKEKETYKRAKEILEKFNPDDESLKKPEVNRGNQTVGKITSATSRSGVRHRNISQISSTPNSSVLKPPPSFSATPNAPVMSPLRGLSPAMKKDFFVNNMPPGTPPGPPKPIPVTPKERTITDRFVDYLVGDGPNNRYALICELCFSHNGMALKEDFLYTTFRCCYCYHLNEAKKKRPFAPPIEGLSTPPVKSRFSRTSINATTLPEGPETSANPVEGNVEKNLLAASANVEEEEIVRETDKGKNE
ncbi:endoplasmic reticulum junction formation protein lunapark-like [Xenia sp. Carnegie-2017]|uniref:endoplasmic reticulum junction formation protein lunapark-like n=1 Tax=Xenia sp. Carnegie-2017 TaxID=2897299 RepID=UPI001F047883|nr:endoplasmic reticulum junction formation protein lunapark-like [Xenia sp. Carnegie-2017]